MSYPDKLTLKSNLESGCKNKDLCEVIATNFAGKKISCNHRVAQRTAFELGSSLPNVDPDDIGTCVEILCSYVDSNHCNISGS